MEPGSRRLESWKEIAAYLGRDVRTVQRWERQEHLPVHRLHHHKLGSVYAYAAEVDAWRTGRELEAGAAAGAPESAARPDEPRRLRRLRFKSGILALGLALLLGVAWLVFGWPPGLRTNGSTQIKSLAVLPLKNFSGDPAQEYFADGITEALIAHLSSIRGLRVVSHTSTMQFKESTESAPAIARKLNVDALVEGSVQRDGHRVRIAIQLIRAATDEHLWSDTYDRELRDLLDLQSEMALAITHHIEAAVTGGESRRMAASHKVNPAAFESYLKGRFELNKGTRQGTERSIAYFQQAIAADSLFGPAYASLARAYSKFGGTFVGLSPVFEARSKAVAAASKALELDPLLGEAHALLAYARQQEWQWEAAEAEYLQAIDLVPGNTLTLMGYAGLLMDSGRTDEALATARHARELDPLSLDNTQRLAWLLYHGRRYDESIRELRTVLAIQPDRVTALWFLGFDLIEKQEFDEAISVLKRSASLSDRSPGALGVLIRAYARAGRRTEALRILDELKSRERKGYVPPAAFVNAYIGLGDYDQAFRWLERAYDERSNITQFLKTHPIYDPLRQDPRFKDLMRRVGLQ
jgi:pentatricopeptide repeat protein